MAKSAILRIRKLAQVYQRYMSMDKLIVITYLIYITSWNMFIFGGTAYIVFWKNESGLWFLLTCVLSGSAIRPDQWVDLIRWMN